MCLLNDNISKTYKRYYNNLLADLGIKHDEKIIYPHYLIKKDLKTFGERFKEKVMELPTELTKDLIYFSTKEIEGRLLFTQKINFTELFDNLPPLISTNLYLNPLKKFKILLKNKEIFVVCELQDPIRYLLNMDKVKELIRPFRNIFCVDLGFVLLCENNKNYLITKFHGKTLEDCIKERRIKPSQKSSIIKQLATLNKLFYNEGIIFGGFAPRNFLISNKKIYIIDFEELHNLNYLSNEKIKYIQDIQTICFSDVFNPKEIARIFLLNKSFYVQKNQLVAADKVEKAYFGKPKITQGERDVLWAHTRIIERAVIRKNEIIYGHNLGQFFSDNFDPKLEAHIVKQFYSIYEKDSNSFKDIILLLDFLIDFYNENKFRKLYKKSINFDISSLVSNLLNKLESDHENFITLIRFFDELDYFNKNNNFIERKKIINLFKKIAKTKTIKNDFSIISLFDKYAFKTVYSTWRDEVKKIHIINKVFPYSPEKIKVYSYKNCSTIIYKNCGTSNLRSDDGAKAAKLLAHLHNIKINRKISKDLESKYLKFDKNTIERICRFFLKLGYKRRDIKLLHEKVMAANKALSLHPRSIIHNDLYYDQFHKNYNIRLLDWTFATVGSPFMDLSSILRDDYDNRNIKLNKKLFLKEYLGHSKFAKKYSKKTMEEGFYINCVRDIIWFIERINLKQTRGGEVYTWLKDAFEDLTRNRFEKFYPGLF